MSRGEALNSFEPVSSESRGRPWGLYMTYRIGKSTQGDVPIGIPRAIPQERERTAIRSLLRARG